MGLRSLERSDVGRNIARFDCLSVQPNLLGEVSLVRTRGRLGTPSPETIALHTTGQDAQAAMGVACRRSSGRDRRDASSRCASCTAPTEHSCGLAHRHMVVRYGYVLDGGVWVGGHALLAMVMMPSMAKQAHHTLMPVALTTLSLLTYTKTATIVLGLVLMTRTRGLAALSRGGEWGNYVGRYRHGGGVAVHWRCGAATSTQAAGGYRGESPGTLLGLAGVALDVTGHGIYGPGPVCRLLGDDAQRSENRSGGKIAYLGIHHRRHACFPSGTHAMKRAVIDEKSVLVNDLERTLIAGA